MDACPGSFTAEAEAELWKHIELHAAIAHQENPEQWSPEDPQQVKKIIQASYRLAVSCIAMATIAPERNVKAAIDVIAHESPKRSAMRPAESAPIA